MPDQLVTGRCRLRIVAMMLLAGVCANAAAAQPPTEDAALLRAHKKITSGIVLLCAGAAALPITGSDTKWSHPGKMVGLPLIGAGSGLILWGLRDREKATGRRRTTIAATVGHAKMIQIASHW